MTVNVQDPARIKVEEDPLAYTDKFTYIGCTVRHDGGAESDISNIIGKARNAFRMLIFVWKSQQYKTRTQKQNCIKAVFLRLYYTGRNAGA